MKSVNKNNNQITSKSALKRSYSALNAVLVGASGAGKTTLINLLLNSKINTYMKIGIGENSQTTIIPCQFCFDERIENDENFAIQIVKKSYGSKYIHTETLKAIMNVFIKNDYDVEDSIDEFDDTVLEQIIEPKEAHYHLRQLKGDISFEDLKESFRPILNYMVDNDFSEKVKQRRKEFKGKKVKITEIKELVFEEMFDTIPEDIKLNYIEWLNNIGTIIEEKLLSSIGEKLFKEEIVEYTLDKGAEVIKELFDPFAPYSLIIDEISIACRPREELIDIARYKLKDLPFRFCIRDTMGITQKGIDTTNLKDTLEIALNCKCDGIIFLLSLEERKDVLSECCRVLVEKKKEMMKKNQLDIPLYVLFTKADRKIENLISKRNQDLYINQDTYQKNMPEIIDELEDMINKYSEKLKEKVSMVSMRYHKDSYITEALKDNKYKKNFEPEGLFEEIVDYVMDIFKSTLPNGFDKPLFVTAIEPDQPVIKVSIEDTAKINDEIKKIQHKLTSEKEIVNGYVISDKTPRIHGKSVITYWNNLTIGLGHKTNASVYGNFSINMKGLLKRVIKDEFNSFKKFVENEAVTFTADNISDEELEKIIKSLFSNGIIEGINPAIGKRNGELQRLYKFYVEYYFKDESKFALLIDRVAYDLSYANIDIKKKLTKIYYDTPGYDQAMRTLQSSYREFFGSDDFIKIFTLEFNQIMTEMVNKTFIVI